ncbi:MAG: hypothetical protein JNM36_00645 [Chitinophagales bacterium]|nr:hypothetical protein [Chitinophagales bacterium]
MIAIIDIGTNTFHLLIINPAAANPYQPIYRQKMYVRLAEGGQSHIIPAAFERGIQAMTAFQHTIAQYPIQQIHALATEGVRRATNGSDFIQAVKQQTNITINTISGDQEAEYIYYGIKQAVPLDQQTVLMMDIGGGSVEFIFGNDKRIFWQQSFPIGASRLYNQFQQTDPLTPQLLNALQQHIKTSLVPLWQAYELYPTDTLIGSSGTFDSLTDMSLARNGQQKKPQQTYYEISMPFFNEITHTLLNTTLEERLQIKGMEAQRADMMPAGIGLVDTIVQTLPIKKIIQSEYAIKEGVIHQFVFND